MILGTAIWICLSFYLGSTQHLRGHSWEWTTARPIVHQEPFVVVWNLPTTRCEERFGITLPLGVYGIVENKGNLFQGQNMTIFYKNQFGLYPYITPEGEWHNGGIPQNVRLNEHLQRASKEIRELLNHSFHGLAVVDWEEWRPLWRRNWGTKKIYREASEQRVVERFPGLSGNEQSYFAELEFEEAARALMEATLAMGRELRPQGLWGFYRFPDCFNDNWEKEDNYTAHCNPKEVQNNDLLMWLWEVSSALYPSIYLPLKLPESHHQRYVHHRLREALRVAQFGPKHPLPVIAYSRVSYRHSSKYLTEADLAYTIGESAALGTAGVALWGDLSYSNSPESCRSLRDYIITTLGPYVVNVTTAAHLCSRQLCHGNGRCVRKQPYKLGTFLHLDPQLWEGERDFQHQEVSAWEQFHCLCYPEWTGSWCERPQWTGPIKGPECNQAMQYYEVYDAARGNHVIMRSNICPPSVYDKKTELR
nr:hyaluronidase-3 [Pogona vitticeps]XP_020644715.1 hyaluronidase-3 [Pogona vitticeps]XP_020644724.1 hyaluronidase-3 [Pogona vitticeps]XP_020644732.1 hyaluronidase-3 [Pogona vitticeps]XP_020644741.1 hyaluronidase-3 [Pogona vitticeps]